MSKQDRQGVRTAADLEQKYSFGKRFLEIMGLVEDTQKSVTEVESTLTDAIEEKYSSLTRTTDEIRAEVGSVKETADALTERVGTLEITDTEISTRVTEVKETTDELQKQITAQSTSILQSCDTIILSALAAYATTAGLEELKKTFQTDFTVWSEGIAGRVTQTEADIKSVDGDLQEKFNSITKCFTFTIDGLTIGQADNPNKVIIDNDDITIMVGDKVVTTFKADGTGLVPILKVTTTANILGLQITQDSTHINIDYVGEVT